LAEISFFQTQETVIFASIIWLYIVERLNNNWIWFILTKKVEIGIKNIIAKILSHKWQKPLTEKPKVKKISICQQKHATEFTNSYSKKIRKGKKSTFRRIISLSKTLKTKITKITPIKSLKKIFGKSSIE